MAVSPLEAERHGPLVDPGAGRFLRLLAVLLDPRLDVGQPREGRASSTDTAQELTRTSPVGGREGTMAWLNESGRPVEVPGTVGGIDRPIIGMTDLERVLI